MQGSSQGAALAEPILISDSEDEGPSECKHAKAGARSPVAAAARAASSPGGLETLGPAVDVGALPDVAGATDEERPKVGNAARVGDAGFCAACVTAAT